MYQYLFYCGKATFQDNSFDAILCASSVPYLDMRIIADKVHAWLKSGGLFAYNTPEVGSYLRCTMQRKCCMIPAVDLQLLRACLSITDCVLAKFPGVATCGYTVTDQLCIYAKSNQAVLFSRLLTLHCCR